MLILNKAFEDGTVELKNSTELKEFLQYQNPLYLRSYIEQLKKIKPEIQVVGIGVGLVLKIRK